MKTSSGETTADDAIFPGVCANFCADRGGGESTLRMDYGDGMRG